MAAAVEHLALRFIGGMQPLPDGHFLHLDALSWMDLDTTVAKRQGMICWITRAGEAVSIQFPGNEVRGPASIECALRFIAAVEAFQARDLPDSLTDQSKLVLVRRLIRDGLLTIRPSAS